MNILSVFNKISTFVFDVDGVLTDGTVLVFSNNELIRKMHIRDGYALQLAVKNNYRIIILSGAESLPVKERLLKLGITEIFQGELNKKEFLQKYLSEKNIDASEVLYMADDMPDIEAMQTIALPCCPADAADDIKNVSKYISPFKGGEGCVRDVVEKVMKLHGKWHSGKAASI